MSRTSRRRRASTYPERSNQKYHVFITFHLHGEIDEKIESFWKAPGTSREAPGPPEG